MAKPLLLDLFCGAGGCSVGYHRAGFDVVGVDHFSQPHFPRGEGFDFIEMDAVAFLDGRRMDNYAVIHASPPCQIHSAAKRIGNARPGHTNLIPHVRRELQRIGLPYVIENVPGAPLHFPLILCGTQFGLRLRRHRLFESNILLLGPPSECCHRTGDYTVFGHCVQMCGSRGTPYQDASGRTHYRPLRRPLKEGQEAMGIDWMNRAELSQAIPPAYTEFIGRQLLNALPNAG